MDERISLSDNQNLSGTCPMDKWKEKKFFALLFGGEASSHGGKTLSVWLWETAYCCSGTLFIRYYIP